MNTESQAVFTNIKFPESDRKKRTYRVITENDPNALGQVAWRQQNGYTPSEHVLVLLSGVYTFVTVEEYRSGIRSKRIRGKEFSILPPGICKKKKPSRWNRRRLRCSQGL